MAYRLSAKGDKVFVFGDAALMGDTVLLDYQRVATLEWDWERILNNFGTNMILFDKGAPLTNVLEKSPRWQLVYTDSRNEIFVPKNTNMTLPPLPKPGSCTPAAQTKTVFNP